MSRLLGTSAIFMAGLPAVMLPIAASELAQRFLAGERRAVAVAAGLAIGVSTYASLVPLFWRILHHELAHAVAATFVGVRPASLQASGAGGIVHFEQTGYVGWARQFMIAIVPYSISPLTVAVVFAATAVSSLGPFPRGVLAAVAGAALTAPLLEIHRRQSDLQSYGFWPAVIAALWLWAGSTHLVIRSLSGASLHTLGMAYVRAAELCVTVGGMLARHAAVFLAGP